MEEQIEFEYFPSVKASVTRKEADDFKQEVKDLCKDYDVDPDNITTSGNGAFESDLIKLMKSYGFKAEMSAIDMFDELKAIG